MVSLAQAFNIAVQHYHAGRISAAEGVCRQILQEVPQQAESLHLLGVITSQAGQLESAADLVAGAIELVPGNAMFRLTMGLIQKALGRADEAISHLRTAADLDPESAEVRNNLGNALLARGDVAEAIEVLTEAVRLRPELSPAHNNLANALKQAGRVPEALEQYGLALRIAPDNVDAATNRANTLVAAGRVAEAVRQYEYILARAPDHAPAHVGHGDAHMALNEPLVAVASFRKALDLGPELLEAWVGLGNAKMRLGRFKQAATAFGKAIEIEPTCAGAHSNLGNALRDLGQWQEAADSFASAIRLDPNLAAAHNNLGGLYQKQGLHGKAADCFRRVLELEPDDPDATNNLANALVELGRRGDAMLLLRELLGRGADLPAVHSNLLFNLDLDPQATVSTLRAERRAWDRLHAAPLRPGDARFPNTRDPNRPLRVGYVSADFRRHSAAHAFGPVLFHHDSQHVEVYCYAGVLRPDDLTSRFRAAASVWRNTVGLSDQALADLVRRDRIDILVDLSGHSEGNRLLVFARKPAPVQVTAWGHAVGTGLTAMDYLFSDRVLVPAQDERHLQERVVCLPNALSFAVPLGVPPVTPLPAQQRRMVTFGCLNRIVKVSDQSLEAWASILRRMPEARLLIKGISLKDGSIRSRIEGFLRDRGAGPDRVELVAGTTHVQHLGAHGRIDIALDPFPQNGGISTLESLWMGVPVITLRGETIPGRIGASLLTTLGLDPFIAESVDEYVDLAVRHGCDIAGLANLRRGLRARVRGSILCDHRAYTRAVENAYRQMWKRWCEGNP